MNILSTIKFLRLIFYTSSNFFHRLKQAAPRSMILEYFYYTRSISDSIFFFNRIYASVMAPRRHPLFTPYDTRIRMGRRTRHIRRHTYACTISYIRIYKYAYVCVYVRTFARLLRASLSPWKRKITGNAKSIDAILGISRIRLSHKATMIFILNRKGPIRKKNRIVEG